MFSPKRNKWFVVVVPNYCGVWHCCSVLANHLLRFGEKLESCALSPGNFRNKPLYVNQKTEYSVYSRISKIDANHLPRCTHRLSALIHFTPLLSVSLMTFVVLLLYSRNKT